jgi:argininosuccinate synthase
MHVSYEGGRLEDPWFEPEEGMFRLTISPQNAPDHPEYVLLSFEDGVPKRLNGEELGPASLVERLNELGGRNGIGRVDIVENRFVGMKSRGVYETPGVTILHVAHRALESITMDREVMHLRDALIPKISELIYYGLWFSPEMQALKAFIEETQKGITGDVRLKLYKGNCIVSGRRSETSLYLKDLATFEREDVYDQKDAGGFIRLNALRLKIRHIGSKREE